MVDDGLARRQRDRRRDQARVEQEVDRRGADQRAAERRERGRGPGPPSSRSARPGALHRDDQRRDAEQRAMERVALLAVQMALAERAAAATSIVSCGPSSSSDAKSTA